MKMQLVLAGCTYEIDTQSPIDLSIPLQNNSNNPLAWYLSYPSICPVVMGDFVGSVASGTSSTNFNTITFNPHAHGTHTECLGHITHQFYSVQEALSVHFFEAQLISVTPEKQGENLVITARQLQQALEGNRPEALVIRTLPNEVSKKSKNYSHTNPPFLLREAAAYLCAIGVMHLLVDLPSVDQEKDEGRLETHKAFWNVTDTQKLNDDARKQATITEFIYVDSKIEDGHYLLNLQTASFINDATPSKPVLYALHKKNS